MPKQATPLLHLRLGGLGEAGAERAHDGRQSRGRDKQCRTAKTGNVQPHLRLGGLGEAGAERAHDGGDVQPPAVLVPVDDHGRQQQDAPVAPRVLALLRVVRLGGDGNIILISFPPILEEWV